MKKITDTQKYAILWLKHNNYSSTQIAKMLKINENQIIEIINNNPKEPTPTGSSIKSLMITESVGQKHQVSIMTKAASEVSDSNRKNIEIDNSNKSSIYKPFNK
jgi:plasmid maintenance system antidote protein VapI